MIFNLRRYNLPYQFDLSNFVGYFPFTGAELIFAVFPTETGKVKHFSLKHLMNKKTFLASV